MFLWWFQLWQWLRRCCAKRRRIAQGPHRLWPDMTALDATKLLLLLIGMQRSQKLSGELLRRASRLGPTRNLAVSFPRLPEHFPFFLGYSDSFISLDVYRRI